MKDGSGGDVNMASVFCKSAKGFVAVYCAEEKKISTYCRWFQRIIEANYKMFCADCCLPKDCYARKGVISLRQGLEWIKEGKILLCFQ